MNSRGVRHGAAIFSVLVTDRLQVWRIGTVPTWYL